MPQAARANLGDKKNLFFMHAWRTTNTLLIKWKLQLGRWVHLSTAGVWVYRLIQAVKSTTIVYRVGQFYQHQLEVKLQSRVTILQDWIRRQNSKSAQIFFPKQRIVAPISFLVWCPTETASSAAWVLVHVLATLSLAGILLPRIVWGVSGKCRTERERKKKLSQTDIQTN